MSQKDEATLKKLVDGLSKGDPAIVDESYSPNLRYHGNGALAGADFKAWKDFFTAIMKAFPDVKATIDDLFSVGDKVAYRLTVTGTQKGEFGGIPATGKKVKIRSIGIARFSGGKIIEEWENFDELGMMQQLGAIPAH
jgi:steroid delta-isomerase-like uncharacterized protein